MVPPPGQRVKKAVPAFPGGFFSLQKGAVFRTTFTEMIYPVFGAGHFF